ncbi:MAG: V-type ATP synthase subunit A [Acholeplasmatales bacterium]|jgi:V/A-type H+-transporting ATPase subunit A|nr:V-type ATP synthase subunit A [Acholeplasmatales bacterium]
MEKEKTGIITKVSGPLIVASNMSDALVYDLVYVGDLKLIGEIIELRNDKASIQVYEETSGIGVGEKVYFGNEPLSAYLAPGLIGTMFDGIGRPLRTIYDSYGNFIPRGVNVDRLNTKTLWDFKSAVKVNDLVSSGTILGSVIETKCVIHKIMVPFGINGKVVSIENGKFSILDTICKIETSNGVIKNISMLQKWPVRKSRPYITKYAPSSPLITGQRVIDSLFPVSLGGISAIPGPFGSGKTIVQHQLAKYSSADIIVYIGCGERGNEMTDVLNEFPSLIDPKTGSSLMERTILIANTSNMPVSAREASIYTGITFAEYYRDMGYNVVVLADSTSRWAESLREMSSRLEEMPGEEGYPAYLGSRLSEFYERAGLVKTLSMQNGSVSAVGAISPAGGDTSEPVSQATLRIVKVFWSLSAALANKRHFPAIDYLKSYSLYDEQIFSYYDTNVNSKYSKNIKEIKQLLQEESFILDIVKLVGYDTLSISDRIKLKICSIIKEDFLHQNAFNKIDAHSSINKQFLMLDSILLYYKKLNLISKKISIFKDIENTVFDELLGRFKYVYEEDITSYYNEFIFKLESWYL